jgi:branched-subunit amino acid ABC-type transport system permease component
MPDVCLDPWAFSVWRAVMAILAVAALLAAPLALITLRRARRKGALAVFATTLSAALVVATGAMSAFLFLRLSETSAQIAPYFPRYPSSCVTADALYRHFSPPPQFFEALQRSISQVAQLETAATIDSVAAVIALVSVLACALIWRRGRPSAS